MSDILPIPTDGTLPRIAWNSVLPAATLTATPSTHESDGIVGNCVNSAPWNFWRPTGSAPFKIVADLGGAKVVNAWAIAGHDADGSVLMETWNGSAWVTHSTAIAAGDGAVLYFVGSSISTTKLRFTFADISFLAILWAGQDMELPEGIGAGWSDPNYAQRAKLVAEKSRDGVFLGTAVEQWIAKLTLSLRNVEAAWVKDNWITFIRQNSARPFFLYWNSTDYPNSACLCTDVDFGETSFPSKDLIDLSVSFQVDTGADPRLSP